MRLNIADTMPHDDATRRPAIYDLNGAGLRATEDCAAYNAHRADAAEAECKRLRELLHEAIECIRDNPEASEYAREIVRLAREALREPADA